MLLRFRLDFVNLRSAGDNNLIDMPTGLTMDQKRRLGVDEFLSELVRLLHVGLSLDFQRTLNGSVAFRFRFDTIA